MPNENLYLVDGAKGHSGTFMIQEMLENEKNCIIIATDLPMETRKEVMTKETVFTKDLG